MEKEYKFTKCPACSSENLLGVKLANEAKLKGIVGLDFDFYLQTVQGAVEQPKQPLPNGATAVVFTGYMDACLDCGCALFRIIRLDKAVKQIKRPPKLVLPSGMSPGRN